VALQLVRHGPPLIQPGRPASTWELDPARHAETSRLRPVLRARAAAASWHSSSEPKATATARLLTDGPVVSRDDLREIGRSDWFATAEELGAAVRDAFEDPTRPARDGWEPFDQARRRVAAAVRTLVAEHGDDLVLVGHGTAWTLLVSELTGRPPDLSAWARLQAPDLCTVDPTTRTVTHAWGDW
jgi:broad specificity phosphatase PhoE